MALPVVPDAVQVLHPPDLPARYLGIAEDHVIAAVSVHIADGGANAIKSKARTKVSGRVGIRTDGTHLPLAAIALDIFEPDVRSDDIEVAIAIQVANRNTGMNGGADDFVLPTLFRVCRDLVPAQVIQIGHGHDLGRAIAIDVRRDYVMHAGQVRVKLEAVKGPAIVAGVAIPNAARDEVQAAVAGDIQRDAADIRWRVATHDMPRPTIRRMILVPVERAVALADDVLKRAIAIQVGQASLRQHRRHIQGDEMLAEIELGHVLFSRPQGSGELRQVRRVQPQHFVDHCLRPADALGDRIEQRGLQNEIAVATNCGFHD